MIIENPLIKELFALQDKEYRDFTAKLIPNVDKEKIIGIRDENNKFIPMPGADIIIGSGARLLLVGTADGIRTTKRLIYKKYKPQEVKYV